VGETKTVGSVQRVEWEATKRTAPGGGPWKENEVAPPIFNKVRTDISNSDKKIMQVDVKKAVLVSEDRRFFPGCFPEYGRNSERIFREAGKMRLINFRKNGNRPV